MLDFVEYLRWRMGAGGQDPEEAGWSAFSLAQALVGLEDEPSPYSTDDIKEPFS